MRFSEIGTHRRTTAEQPPVTFQVRVGAGSLLQAKQIIERRRGWQLVACEGEGQDRVITVVVTATASDDDWDA